MAYCRWSSDNWNSDVYAYEAPNNEYAVHVASVRYPTDPPCPDLDWTTSARLTATYREQKEWLTRAQARMTRIGLPHDGQTFVHRSVADLHGRLLALKTMGYRVPESALLWTAEEAAEDATQETAQPGGNATSKGCDE